MSFYKQFQNNSNRLPLTLIACIVFLICALVFSSNRTQIDHSLRVATSHAPENFSELYFTDYAKLSKNVSVGSVYPVQFTIVNHESKSFTYTYQTQLVERNVSQVSAIKTITIENGQSARETAQIFARQPGDQVELIIKLLNKNLTIHYKAQS